MGDTPELTPLERVWIADECPEGEACRGLFGFVGENAREGMTEYIRADLYAELEQALKERDDWIDELHACLFQPGPVGLHTLLLVAQGIARAAVDARQGADDENT